MDIGNGATAASRTTYHIDSVAWAVLRPANVAQVASALAIAKHRQIRVLPVSTGLNWGYGSRVPVTPGVVVSLGRLNRIVDYNDTLGWVRVQAGVTQRQLYQFLLERGGRYWMDATGSSTAASVVGNALERGFGHTPYSDHFAQCCNLEVVLPDGEVLRTGFGQVAGCHAASVYRYGIGPVLDGLFSQSKLGVVTEATLWLMPKPESFRVFSVSVAKPFHLDGLVSALAQARLEGTLTQPIHVGNVYRMLASVTSFPFDDVPEGQALSGKPLTHIQRRYGLPSWSGLGAVYGTYKQTQASLARIRQLLRITKARFSEVTPSRLRVLAFFAPVIKGTTGIDLTPAISTAAPVFDLLRGIPTDVFLKSAYWRMRHPPAAGSPLDLDADGVGLRWIAPVAPATPEHVERLVKLTQDILLAHGLEPLLTLNFIAPRAVALVTGITWDRSNGDEDERAHRAHDELLGATLSHGYWPYRLSTGTKLPVDLSLMKVAGALAETSNLLSRVASTDQ